MSDDKRPTTNFPERIPLTLEFHYEVDERGDNYRVWEEQFREPVGIGGDLDHLSRRLNP
jgi:hypothetical protein